MPHTKGSLIDSCWQSSWRGRKDCGQQVQKLVLDSIITLEWTEAGLETLPSDFVLQAILPAIMHPLSAKGSTECTANFIEWIHSLAISKRGIIAVRLICKHDSLLCRICGVAAGNFWSLHGVLRTGQQSSEVGSSYLSSIQ